MSSHATGDGFRFHEQLFSTFNPSNQVGNDRGHCTENDRNRKVRCRVIAHLNGEVGGFGFLRINGNIGRHDNRLNIVGGTDDFAGVAGKVVLRDGGDRLEVDLTR